MFRESYGLEQTRLLPGAIEDQIAGWFARCGGIALCMGAVAVWLSLLTWSVTDPSLTQSVHGPTRNVLGPAGAIVSDLLLQLLGLTSVLVVLVPAIWGLELMSSGRIPMLRRRFILFPMSVVALAIGCSAMPTSATWPLHHGFGGLLGDLFYNLVAGLLTTVLPARAGVVAGLVMTSSGLSAFAYCLGFGVGRSLPVTPVVRSRLRRPHDRQRGAGGWWGFRRRHERHPQIEPVLEPALGAGRQARRPAAPTSEPAVPDAAGGAPAARSDWAPLLDGGAEAEDFGSRDSEFDQSTDIESRKIAERFAPESARAARPDSSATNTLFGSLSVRRSEPGFKRPSLNLLKRPSASKAGGDATQAALRVTARDIVDVLADFGVKGEIRDIKPGPVVTLFELEPARGTKSSRVVGLAEDIARSMSKTAVRVAVVPGRNVIGIELPNTHREPVLLRELLEAESFRTSDAKLPLALGKSIGGDPVIVDLSRMPHLLVAGTTGSGKSVGINAMVLSLLYKLAPEDCRLLMIDPKMLELSVYNGIPHLLTPVVTDPQKAVAALNWAVREMEERYKRMARLSVRNIDVFNNRVRNAKARGEQLQRTVQTGFDRSTGQAVFETETLDLKPMPHIVIVVDEFADLMIVAGKEIEAAVQRLAQMARAAGIHLIMATQRPSVDVITGTIKANFPTRISFRVTSKVDSRTILNEQGAEQLLGHGDMLFSAGSGQAVRVHGPFVSDEEVESIAQVLREQGSPNYVMGITDTPAADEGANGMPFGGGKAESDLYTAAVEIVLRDRKPTTSYLQRRLSIGYNRAADLIERMEREGIISAPNGMKQREILATSGGCGPDAT